MSKISELRTTVAGIVASATSLTTHEFLPGRVAVPCAIVMPGAPYVTDGNTFGSFDVQLTVDLIMGQAANSVSSAGLDDQIENALIALVNAGLSVANVSQPFSIEINNGSYLAATLTILETINP